MAHPTTMSKWPVNDTKHYLWLGFTSESIQLFIHSHHLITWSYHLSVATMKKKASHTRYRALGPELIPVYGQSAHRWLWGIHPVVGCHYFLPGLQLPSQPHSVTPWPVAGYPAWWQRHIGVNNLPKTAMQLLLWARFEPTTCWSQVCLPTAPLI